MVVADDGPAAALRRLAWWCKTEQCLRCRKEEGPHSSLNNLRLGREALRIRAELREALQRLLHTVQEGASSQAAGELKVGAQLLDSLHQTDSAR